MATIREQSGYLVVENDAQMVVIWMENIKNVREKIGMGGIGSGVTEILEVKPNKMGGSSFIPYDIDMPIGDVLVVMARARGSAK